MTTSETAADIPVRKNADVETCEHIISEMRGASGDGKPNLLVSSNYPTALQSDIWVAMALGTILRRFPQASAIARGLSDEHPFDTKEFGSRLPGLVLSYLCGAVRKEGGSAINLVEATRWIEQCGGRLKGIRGAEQYIVESGAARAEDLSRLTQNLSKDGRSVFGHLLEEVCRDLGVQAKSGVHKAQSASEPVDDLAKFVQELFENAFSYGRLNIDQASRDLRFVRFRRFSGGQNELLARTKKAAAFLEKHLAGSLQHGSRWDCFMEINVSDFGPGILSGFLSTQAGDKYKNSSKAAVLGRLLHEDLTSKSLDPNAGRGIPKALEAARELRAFVGVRTDEFWLGQSFLTGSEDISLRPIQDKNLDRVSGTHWQIIWPTKTV